MITISGISASGKSHLVRYASEVLGITIVPSITTRNPRNDESDDADREFISSAEFDELLTQEGVFFEKNVYGNRYAFDARCIPLEKAVFQIKYIYINEFKSTIDQPVSSIYVIPEPLSYSRSCLDERANVSEAEQLERVSEMEGELKSVAECSWGIDYTFVNRFDEDSCEEFLKVISKII